MEKWSQQAAELGTRALDTLRDGVQEAIAALGRGFLAHLENRQLKDDLKNGTLTTQDYYRQLLRLVYRLLFLFVAEDRDLLLLPDTSAPVRQQYDAYYSVSRLRRLAETRRGGPHPDLYVTLSRLFGLLRTGYEPLGLPGLGGFLFSERATLDLDAVKIANRDLLTAVSALAFTTEGKVRRPVDYKNLGSEEFGSVYESLLELHPKMHVPSASFTLDVTAGSERKTTGSYYTDTSLIQSLLDSALEPVVADRLQEAGRGLRPNSHEWQAALEKALLAIKVVDMAAGSGHFLIGAARRLARHLARIRTEDDEPGPEAVRHALRDVVSHCIYGVDINEMAVELCKVALWMETLDPGRPLTFLDRNIRCGNSLIGAVPALLHGGIPDDAFMPIISDDKSYCSQWKKQNKAQKNQETLFSADMRPWQRLHQVASDMRQMDALDDNTLTGVQQQETAFYELHQSSDYLDSKLWADAWCAAFLWIKAHDTFEYPITEDVFRRIGSSPDSTPAWLKKEIDWLSQEYQFFHWHLEFPQIFQPKDDLGDPNDVTGWEGGFDVVLGNPPWERVKLQEKEWFASRDEAIATAPNAAARRKLIAQLPKTNPALHKAFEADKRKAEGESHFLRNSGKYPLCGRGDVNTYPIFSELSRQIIQSKGRAGIIVPTGLVTDFTTRYFFNALIENQSLESYFGFKNERFIFPKPVEHTVTFGLLTILGHALKATRMEFCWLAYTVEEMKDMRRRVILTQDDFTLINPNTGNCPIFRTHADAELTKSIYKRFPILIDDRKNSNPWQIRLVRVFDINKQEISRAARSFEELLTSSTTFQNGSFYSAQEVYLPVIESKLIHQYDHRYATYENSSEEDRRKGLPKTTDEREKTDPNLIIYPRIWLPENIYPQSMNFLQENDWLIGYRNFARSTDERTIIVTILPFAATDFPLRILFSEKATSQCCLLIANLNSLPFDYVARQKVGGTDVSSFIFKQLPIIPPQQYRAADYDFIVPRVLELTYTSWSLRSFAKEAGYEGPPFIWNTNRRFLLNAELNAYYGRLYGLSKNDLQYILDPEDLYGSDFPGETFRVLKQNELKHYGEYRTKRLILEIHDEMSEAAESDQPYQTRLSPQPAHPDAAHPWDEAYLDPKLPRDQWWRDIETGTGKQGDKEEKKKLYASEQSTGRVVKEPAPTFELKRPPTPQPKPKAKPTPSLATQPALITDFSPPKGSRAQRLRTVMSLGQPKSQAELQALVGALADEDDSIRWLAGSSLTRLGGLAVVNMLAAFLQSELGDTPRQEALKVLGLIADTHEDESVRTAAHVLANKK